MFAPQTNPASPAVFLQTVKRLVRFVSLKDVYHCLEELFPVYQFFLAVARGLTNFGVRLYVSIVAGGSTTTSIVLQSLPTAPMSKLHPLL